MLGLNLPTFEIRQKNAWLTPVIRRDCDCFKVMTLQRPLNPLSRSRCPLWIFHLSPTLPFTHSFSLPVDSIARKCFDFLFVPQAIQNIQQLPTFAIAAIVQDTGPRTATSRFLLPPTEIAFLLRRHHIF